MVVLGIETSCDETAAAVVAGGKVILSNVIWSQVATHHAYGGVVPELASRKHIEKIVPVKKGIVIDIEKKKLKKIKVIKGTHPLPSKKNIKATNDYSGP